MPKSAGPSRRQFVTLATPAAIMAAPAHIFKSLRCNRGS